MNFYAYILSNLFQALAERQHWADSDKAGGALRVIVPVAEGIVHHIAGDTVAGSPIITITQHQSVEDAQQSARQAAQAAALAQPGEGQ
jgi:hypothetical protein